MGIQLNMFVAAAFAAWPYAVMAADPLPPELRGAADTRLNGDRPRFIFTDLFMHPGRIKVCAVRPGEYTKLNFDLLKHLMILKLCVHACISTVH